MAKESWESLNAGRAGGGILTRFDASGFPTRIAAEVKVTNFHDRVPEAERLLASDGLLEGVRLHADRPYFVANRKTVKL